jgi:DNA-binding transcriptional regulator YhcF (GntR family)
LAEFFLQIKGKRSMMNFKDKEPIYIQIADFVTEHISLAKWLPEEKIPSVRDLAGDLQVNPNTVMRAYEYLQNQEIIFNKRGLGLFVNTNAVEIINGLRREKFLQQELPIFFKSLFLLDIDLEELKNRYVIFKRENFKK